MGAAENKWFRRGSKGLGHFPRTWQGWASLAAFMVVLAESVEIMQTYMAENGAGQGIVWVVAALEIIAFMGFVRRHSQVPDTKTPEK